MNLEMELLSASYRIPIPDELWENIKWDTRRQQYITNTISAISHVDTARFHSNPLRNPWIYLYVTIADCSGMSQVLVSHSLESCLNMTEEEWNLVLI